MDKDRLDKLWPHLSHMTPDQLREHVRRIRADRRLTKQKSSTIKKAKVSSDSARVRAKGLVAKLDPAALARMLRDLENANKG